VHGPLNSHNGGAVLSILRWLPPGRAELRAVQSWNARAVANLRQIKAGARAGIGSYQSSPPEARTMFDLMVYAVLLFGFPLGVLVGYLWRARISRERRARYLAERDGAKNR
jgi:hypothetical protein